MERPTTGGRWSRDPKTGELTRVIEDEATSATETEQPAASAATKKKEK